MSLLDPLKKLAGIALNPLGTGLSLFKKFLDTAENLVKPIVSQLPLGNEALKVLDTAKQVVP
ncbi:MAG: hypothetical protein K1X89_08230 [Myxococcaceae bacterium]|nr:hypothetical protein [Myxococcaceae bacterium]